MENEDLLCEFEGDGLSPAEKRWGKKLYNSYLQFYPHLHKLSDLQFLDQLVFHEALHKRYKKQIGKVAKDTDKDNKAVPQYMLKNLSDNLEQLFKLKERLGMMEDKQKLDVYQDWEQLKNKFALWREKNQGSR
ncbi:MAG: hypothetical protein ACTSYR_06185, partial [Candidatus Odinarchaeia archaeon]